MNTPEKRASARRDAIDEIRVDVAAVMTPACALADWRRRINDLYGEVRRRSDPQDAWHLWRETRMAMFRHHPVSPIAEADRMESAGIPAFPYDPALRFRVLVNPAEGEPLDYDLGPDGRMRAAPAGVTDGLGDALGGELTVYWISGYGGGLFLPFKDATAGAGTYGGGRYVLDTIKGADLGFTEDGRLIVDFNFAYNPSCAVNPAYVCPLAPPENTLPAEIRAGEKAP